MDDTKYNVDDVHSNLSRLVSSLVIIKLLIGINLRAYALSRYANMQERAEEDQRNDRSRPHIGVNAGEMVSQEAFL